MKECPMCHNLIEDDAAFCDRCGARLDQNQAGKGTGTQQPSGWNPGTPPQGYSPYGNSAQGQTSAPKRNKGMIIGIVAAVLIILAIIGSLSQSFLQHRDQDKTAGSDGESFSQNTGKAPQTGTDDSTVTDQDTAESVPYSKGSVVDGWYVNDWANMQVDTTAGDWSFGSQEEYSSYEGDGKTECGLILDDNTNGCQLVICFEALTWLNASTTEEECLDTITTGVKEVYDDAGITYSMDDYYASYLAGETFQTAKITLNDGALTQIFLVRKYDDHMIYVIASAQDSTVAESVLSNVIAAH